MVFVIAAVLYVAVVVFTLSLCKAAARGDRLAEQAFKNRES